MKHYLKKLIKEAIEHDLKINKEIRLELQQQQRVFPFSYSENTNLHLRFLLPIK